MKKFSIRFTYIYWGPNGEASRGSFCDAFPIVFDVPGASGPFLLPWPLYQFHIPPKCTLPGQSMSFFFLSKFSCPVFHSLGTKWQPSSLRKKFCLRLLTCLGTLTLYPIPAQYCGSNAENLGHFDRAWRTNSICTLWPHCGGNYLYSLCESLICCQPPIYSKNHSYWFKTKWDAWVIWGFINVLTQMSWFSEGQLPWTKLELIALSKSVRSLFGDEA